MTNKTLNIEGMTCASCEMRIENKLKKLDGVVYADASYANGLLNITYNEKKVSLESISTALDKMDYHIKNPAEKPAKTSDGMSIKQLVVVGLVLFGLYLIISNTVGFNFIPTVDASMGYGILFVVGLITSLHCIAMCGGINISQTVSKVDAPQKNTEKLMPSLLYNAGRVVSYTIIGGIVGALGSVVSLSNVGKAAISIIAGVFMIIMALNMLNIFPWLRKLQPRLPKALTNRLQSGKQGKGPFIVGLLNGFMPCGPLQAMQIYALGTGSFFAGALSMFLFSMGTVPLMFGLGALSSLLTSKFTKNMMKISAALVMVLGVVMLSRGLALSGVSVVPAMLQTQSPVAEAAGDVQEITTILQPNSYEPITVKAGIPVKWTIKADAKNINGCNNEFFIPEYNINVKLKPGDNIVKFTPTKAGNVGYSCWMGMINSNIKVVE